MPRAISNVNSDDDHRMVLGGNNGQYGLGEVLMFTSVFSFLVVVAGDGFGDWFITVVLLSFFSAGGFVTVVSFCSQAAKSAKPASRQIEVACYARGEGQLESLGRRPPAAAA